MASFFKFLVTVVAFISAAAHAVPTNKHYPKSNSGRIVGGQNALEGQFPYMVSLRVEGNFCGGAILNENWILTAAHCVYDDQPGDFKIFAGSHKLDSEGYWYNVSKIVMRPEVNPSTFYPDIALLKVSEQIKFSEKVQPISLKTEDVTGDVDAIFSGWGRLQVNGEKPNDLQYLKLKTITNEDCQSYHTYPISSDILCTFTKGGEGACNGDSGSPLVSNGKVVGIGVRVVPCARGYPDIHTRVSSFTNWIFPIINQN